MRLRQLVFFCILLGFVHAQSAQQRLINLLKDQMSHKFQQRDLEKIEMTNMKDEDETCLTLHNFPYPWSPPQQVFPPSPYCSKYNEKSCCTYEETFRLHKTFVEKHLFRNDKFIQMGPNCIAALENFFCYPCSPDFGRFFEFDARRGKIIWRICEDTCDYLYENCQNELNFRKDGKEELCDEIERSIENFTYSVVDVVQTDQECYDAEPDNDEISGCVVTWIVFVTLISVLGIILIGLWAFLQYRRTRYVSFNDHKSVDDKPENILTQPAYRL